MCSLTGVRGVVEGRMVVRTGYEGVSESSGVEVRGWVGWKDVPVTNLKGIVTRSYARAVNPDSVVRVEMCVPRRQTSWRCCCS